MLKKYANLIVAAILVLVFAVSVVVSSQESTTMDEQAHIPSGYTYMKYHDMRLNPEHPPLLKDLAGLPLLFLNVNFPTDDPAWQSGVNEQWQLGNKFIHNNNADAITFWSRFPIILIGLLLGFFIYRWTKELAGTVAGLFALVLYAFDPNVLGHNHYVTTDLGIAAFIFMAFYYFIRFLQKPDWKNTLLAGIFLGLAELAKFSAVLLFPFFGLVLFIYALSLRQPEISTQSLFQYKWMHFWIYIRKFILILIVCFALIYVVYYFNTFNMPAGKVTDVTNYVGFKPPFSTVFISMDQNDLLRPLSEYFLGVGMVFIRVSGGNTFYFLGEVDNKANPAYFPIVFLLKETLPFLFLLAFALIFATQKTLYKFFARQAEKNYLRRFWQMLRPFFTGGVAQYSMLGFIVLYAYLSITGNLNIGFRHLFPILPFAYVLVAKMTFDFLSGLGEHTRKTFQKILVVVVAWIILEPIIFFPSYISYFNEAAGGPKNGYKYVVDSNLDWGQDLKRLRNWVDEYNKCSDLMKNNSAVCMNFSKIDPHPTLGKIDEIRVDYFGGSSPAYYLKDKFVPWHAGNDPEPGWYAICAEFLQENTYKQKGPGEKGYEWTQNYQPIRIGDSFFVFYVPETEE